MRQNSDHRDETLSASVRKSSWPVLSMLIFTLIAGAMAIMMILDHRNSVNNALETGQCLVGEGAESFLEVLRHFYIMLIAGFLKPVASNNKFSAAGNAVIRVGLPATKRRNT
ncbi:hypothetical protein [Pantoea agglomerans]|uniref:hypothetical protein n=1 Tax=Enterobacter agglomerans TaxID=549 RepID=UPI00384C7BAD